MKVKGGINLCGIDRIDSSKGYNKHNVVPCCNICNTMKMSRDIYEWLRCIKRIYENNSGKTEEWDKWIGRVEKEINEIVNGGGY